MSKPSPTRARGASFPAALGDGAVHEMALARSVVDIVEETAVREQAARVRTVRVLVGALAHVDPGALAFGFEAASAGSRAEGAKLVIERGPGKAYCVPCGAPFGLAAREDECPRCGAHQWLMLEGEELRVIDLEVD